MIDNEKIINEILNKFDTHEKFFNGKNTTSKSKFNGNAPFNERYPITFTGGLAFLNNNFINRIEHHMQTLPLNDKKLDDDKLGYILPSSKVIENFIRKNTEEDIPIINQSVDAINDFKITLINDISVVKPQHRQRVKFITGKVGSGKSTFINYFSRKYNDTFIKNNIFNIILNYEDIGLEDFNDEISSKKLDEVEKTKHFKKHIKNTIYTKIIERYFKLIEQGSITSCFWSDNSMSHIFPNNVCIELELDKSIKSAKQKSEYLKENFENQLAHIVKFISNILSYKFLIFFDGFDILNPKLINEFDFYITHIQNIIFEPITDELNVYYVLTLRNCTFQKFICGNVAKYRLVPANEDKIILRSLRLVADENKFVKKHLEDFETMFLLIIEQLEKNLSFDEYTSIVEIFDYNYRLLLEYFFQVLCYVINEHTDSGVSDRRQIKEFQQLISNISTNDYQKFKKFLEGKFYILNLILLNKNKLYHTPPYKIYKQDRKNNTYLITNTLNQGRHSYNRNDLSFLDNIYNYLLSSRYFTKDSTFPLLVQLRMLQILDSSDDSEGYTIVEDIEKQIKALGYKTKYLQSLINHLVNSKFEKFKIKTPKTNEKDEIYQYAIRNRGKLVIRNLCLTNAYIDTISPYIMLPNSVSDKIGIKGHTGPDIVRNRVINSYIFLNIVRDIEKFESKKNQVLAETFSIAKKLQENIKSELESTIKHIMTMYFSKKEDDGAKYLKNILDDLENIRKNQ